MMKLAALAAATILTISCASAPPRVAQIKPPASAKLQLHVYPRAMMAGAAMRVTCRVPLRAMNRAVVFGVVGVRQSTDDLHGDAGPITHEIFIEHIPCEAGEAFCVVADSFGRVVEQERTSFEVSGCGTQGGGGRPPCALRGRYSSVCRFMW